MDTVMTFQLVLFQYKISALLIHSVHRTQTCRTAQTSRVDPWEHTMEHTIVPSLANRKFYDGAMAWCQDEERLRGVDYS